MAIPAILVLVLLAAIVVPIVKAEMRRRVTRKPAATRPRPPVARAPNRDALRLVVSKSDMDRELTALLAKDGRKRSESDE